MKSSEPTDSRYRRSAFSVVLIVATGAVLWGLFHWVIDDADLFLKYVKALVWPVVVLTGVFWLRGPIRAKVGQILRVEGWGASVAFQESPAEQLGNRIKGAVDQLGLSIPRAVSLDSTDDTGESPDPQEIPDVDGVATTEEVEMPTEEPAKVANSQTNETVQPDIVEVLAEFSNRLAIVLGLSDSVRASIRANLEVDPQLASQQLTREIEAREVAYRQTQSGEPEQVESRRENVESIIRDSAEWGYDLGRSGAARTVPDIHWNADGTWKITTEVPKRRQTVMNVFGGSDDTRAIRELESEIKELERKQHSTIGRASFAMQDRGWLNELKRRLREIDPGNIWLRD